MVNFLAEILETHLRSFLNILSFKVLCSKLTPRSNYSNSLYKVGENIDIGIGAKLYVSTYKRSLKFKESFLLSFLDGLRRNLSRLVERMLNKSRLTHSFISLAGAISLNIIAIKYNRFSFEENMAKLSLKLPSQEKNSVKEGDEAKEQFPKIINNLDLYIGWTLFMLNCPFQSIQLFKKCL